MADQDFSLQKAYQDYMVAVLRSNPAAPLPWQRLIEPVEVEQRRKAREEAGARVRAALAAADGLARAVAELHSPSSDSFAECQGCDPGSYAESGAMWPCSTIEALAPFVGIDPEDLKLL